MKSRASGGGAHEGPKGMKCGGHMGEMKHGPHQLHEGHMDHHKRASGGGIGDDDKMVKTESYAGTGSETEKEAERKKRGGAVHKRARGGSVHKHGMPMHVDGHKPAHHRLDRPGRKRGGAVGADSKPMTTAHNLSAPEGMGSAYGTSLTGEKFSSPMSAKTNKEDD